MNTDEIRSQLDTVRFFQKFELLPGVMTNGQSPVQEHTTHFQIPPDLHGKRVLDVGCNDGYFTFLAEARGASVVAIDVLPRRAFFWAQKVRGSKAEFHQMDVYDVSPDRLGMFDIVFMFGVYYHLKHPILALERLATVTRECILVESEIIPVLQSPAQSISRFYEGDELEHDPSNWWVPNVDCLLQTIRAAGFVRAEHVSTYTPRRCVVRGYKGPRTAGKPLTDDFIIALDSPAAHAEVKDVAMISGWTLSQREPEGGIEDVIVYLDRLDDPSREIGKAARGIWRSDLVAWFGDRYGASGFRLDWDTSHVPLGEHELHVMTVGKQAWNYRSVPINVSKHLAV